MSVQDLATFKDKVSKYYLNAKCEGENMNKERMVEA